MVCVSLTEWSVFQWTVCGTHGWSGTPAARAVVMAVMVVKGRARDPTTAAPSVSEPWTRRETASSSNVQVSIRRPRSEQETTSLTLRII